MLYSVVQEQMRVSARCLRQHEQTEGGACCKRPRQRGTDASRTCFFGLVASCDVRDTCPTQKKLPVFFNRIQKGPRKKQSSYFGDPQTGEVYKNQVKNRRKKNNQSFIRTNTSAEYVPGRSYVRAETSPPLS